MCSRIIFGGIIRFTCVFISFVALIVSAVPQAARGAIASYGNTFRIDPSFTPLLELSGLSSPGGIANNSAEIAVVVATADGGFLVGGSFSSIGGQQHLGLAKVKADGSVDPTFNPAGGADNQITSIVVQANGRLVVAGYFNTYNGVSRAGIARLNADGSLDTSFDPGYGFDGHIHTVAVQVDGKVVVGGIFSSFNGTTRRGLARLNSDGTLDTTFNAGIGLMAGTHDGYVAAVAVQPNGRIVAGGGFTTYNGTPCNRLVRLNADGSLDVGFSSGTGFDLGTNGDGAGYINELILLPDGRMMVGGHFAAYNGIGRTGIARLNADGSLDASFTPGAITGTYSSFLNTFTLQADGRVVVAGSFTAVDGVARPGIARLNADGSLDTLFNVNGGFKLGTLSGGLYALAVQVDGRVVVGGSYTDFDGIAVTNLVRLSSMGARDTTLATDSLRKPGVATVAVPTGLKIVVGGGTYFNVVTGAACPGVARLNADGTLDPTFYVGSGFGGNFSSGDLGPPTVLNTFTIQPDGRIIVGGDFTSYNGTPCSGLARLGTNGSLDNSFNTGVGFNGYVTSVVIQPDGRLVVVGHFSTFNGASRLRIARLNTDGSLDASFNPGTGFSGDVTSLALQADGRLLVGGEFPTFNGVERIGIARLNADGSLDTSFNPGLSVDNAVLALAVQPDGRVVVGGKFRLFGGVARGGIARLNTDGSLDTSFFPGAGFYNGPNNQCFIRSLVMQTDGRLVAGGYFSTYNGVARQAIARLNADGSLDSGFTVNGLMRPGAVHELCFMDDGRLLVAGAEAVGSGVVQVGVNLFMQDPAAPQFTLQPQSATASVGDAVTLIATATGVPAPTYQWYKGSAVLTGQTGTSLNLTNVQAADAANYTVVATNSSGTVTSAIATLTVVEKVPTTPASGGGGAPSTWFVLALFALLVSGRRRLEGRE